MDGFLRQSTAATLKIGPFLDVTNGDTEEDGFSTASAGVRLSKNGGNFAAKHEGTALQYDEVGFYECKLDTTDTDTVGRLQLVVHEHGALIVWHTFVVLDANSFDTFFGSAQLHVDVEAIEGMDATNRISQIVGTVMTTMQLDHLIQLPVDTDLPTTVHDDSVLGHLLAKAGVANFDRTADSNEALEGKIDGLNDLSAQDVWEYGARTLTGVGNTGEFEITDYEYDDYHRPTQALKTYADGTEVLIEITYTAKGISLYKETLVD